MRMILGEFRKHRHVKHLAAYILFIFLRLSTVHCAYNSNTLEAEVGGQLQVQGQPGRHQLAASLSYELRLYFKTTITKQTNDNNKQPLSPFKCQHKIMGFVKTFKFLFVLCPQSPRCSPSFTPHSCQFSPFLFPPNGPFCFHICVYVCIAYISEKTLQMFW